MKWTALVVASVALTGALGAWSYGRWAESVADTFQRNPVQTTYSLVQRTGDNGLAGSVWRARGLGTCGYVHQLDLAFETDTSGVEVNRATLWEWDTPFQVSLGRWPGTTYREPFVVREGYLVRAADSIGYRLGARTTYEVQGGVLTTRFVERGGVPGR